LSQEILTIDEQLLRLETLVTEIDKRKTRKRISAYVSSILEVKENLIRLQRRLRRFPAITVEDANDKTEANDLIEDMLSNIRERERLVAESKTEILSQDVQTLRIVFSELRGSLPVAQIMFSVDFAGVPPEIREELRLDFEEVRNCYYNDAFRSAIGMCGRVLELMLARKYFEDRNIDLIEQKLFIGQIIRKCFEDNVILEPSLGHMSNLINSSRIDSVHTGRRIYRPSQEETRTVIEFTISLLGRLYPHQPTQ
jgi:hypothetical protein